MQDSHTFPVATLKTFSAQFESLNHVNNALIHLHIFYSTSYCIAMSLQAHPIELHVTFDSFQELKNSIKMVWDTIRGHVGNLCKLEDLLTLQHAYNSWNSCRNEIVVMVRAPQVVIIFFNVFGDGYFSSLENLVGIFLVLRS
jgi:hypothetical protein